MNFNDYVKNTFSECQMILNKKSADYSSKDDILSCFKDASSIAGIKTHQSILNMIGIKLSRLKELLNNDKNPNFESIDDNVKDLINYCAFLGYSVNDKENNTK